MRGAVAEERQSWRGRCPLAEVPLRGIDAEGRILLYDTPLGVYVSVWAGGEGLREGAVYRLGREVDGRQEIFSWFPPLYGRRGEAVRQVMTQKVSTGELWGTRFLLWDHRGAVLQGQLDPLGEGISDRST